VTGFATAAIDGVLSSGEWDRAARLDFAATIGKGAGGGTAPATLFTMNDAQNLYLALRIGRTTGWTHGWIA
jgi:hypothetical protein